ncbi:MAG: methyltransferase domain-containing protein, partial [Oscillospiraceae bacterium]|nr:methyltransferase domain-containing protein [Oscillospiraceae bacterium]
MTTFCKETAAMLICPKCGESLAREGKSFLCPQKHCFDIAKSGYVNLLQSNKMNSAMPGDNKLMVQSRKKFLDKGYYVILAEALCRTVSAHVCEECRILDAGCGEGYYTEKITETVKDMNAEIIGIDISKTAADYAARRTKSALFVAASVFNMPVKSESCNIVTSLFAPYCGEEFLRVLKRGGIFIMVIPAERHLWQLKCSVYDEPYPNAVKD